MPYLAVVSKEGPTVFSKFSTTIQAAVLTLEAVRQATALPWIEVDLDAPEIPADPGVYLWVDAAAPHPLRYHGSGSGTGGLRARLYSQIRWRSNQLGRLAVEPQTLDERGAYDLARESPAIQQAADDRRRLFYAIAQPASWSVEGNDIAPPDGALQWEAFISAVSLLVTGHRGLIGGGAWESKKASLGELMTELAWGRLVDVQDGDWL